MAIDLAQSAAEYLQEMNNRPINGLNPVEEWTGARGIKDAELLAVLSFLRRGIVTSAMEDTNITDEELAESVCVMMFQFGFECAAKKFAGSRPV